VFTVSTQIPCTCNWLCTCPVASIQICLGWRRRAKFRLEANWPRLTHVGLWDTRPIMEVITGSWSFAPHPTGGAYSTPPAVGAGFKGEGKAEEDIERGLEKGRGKDKKGEKMREGSKKEERSPPITSLPGAM